jgi:hypothetical protein
MPRPGPRLSALARLALVVLLGAGAADARATQGGSVLRVGPHGAFARIADAARAARSGDIVEIEAGEYADDAASWPQDRLTIRSVGGVARIVSHGATAQDKALFVISGTDVLIQGIAFAGARVADRNGAGIRHQGGRLTVRDCLFERNEMGILTWNDARAELTVEASEFRDNGLAPPAAGHVGHQIYAGSIARFTLRDSYLHRGIEGHLVKSRARDNRILNNRLTDEPEGTASYELEFPNGGIAFVLGNIIEQSEGTRNPVMISFGAEGYRWRDNELYVVHNTLADRLPRGGTFVRVRPGAGVVKVVDNLLAGAGVLDLPPGAEVAANARAGPQDLNDAAQGDYRVRAASPLAHSAIDPGTARGVALQPARQYAHPRGNVRWPSGPATPGALQTLVD